jgi:hypothetical protein
MDEEERAYLNSKPNEFHVGQGGPLVGGVSWTDVFQKASLDAYLCATINCPGKIVFGIFRKAPTTICLKREDYIEFISTGSEVRVIGEKVARVTFYGVYPVNRHAQW